ncbi:diguanylate cyclase [Paenibacillus contaminans]|uniref:Diguanylate cyclase n=1 Tax=Paenibacillus contaminans TaxID=450362 RepID=A0A329MKV5_9BACL|nr:diguanylate cyclase [Paenibacillus contaminans]RAV20435.1 diguanylate cyclase [Paenibacillus contaminans]
MLKNLIANMALLTAYLFVVTQLFRNRPVDIRASNRRKLLFGTLSGGFGIVLMSYSLVLDELTRLDLRYLAVMVAAQYGGLTAALPAGLIVALGRVLFFGGFNHASITGSVSIIIFGAVAGMAAERIASLWPRWTIFLLSFSVISSAGMLYSFGMRSLEYLPIYLGVGISGGYFTAYLVSHLNRSTATLMKLKDASVKDFLTGLNNRRSFNTAYQAALTRVYAQERPLSLLLLDIDHFKQINDTYGHGAGDAVLAQFGRMLSGMMRSQDTISRIGGEEFSIILPDCPHERALEIAERIRQAAESYVYRLPNGNRLTATVSVGAASFPDTPAGELLSEADAALYEAKRLGRNRVCSSKQLKERK